MTELWLLALPLLIIPLQLRGQGLHNFLVEEAAKDFQDEGCRVRREHRIRLADGTVNYADLFVEKTGMTFICEIETSARHVVDNAAKAQAARLPLWIVVPNPKVRSAVLRRLKRTDLRPGGKPIKISLKGQLRQGLTNYFSGFSSANQLRKNGKTDRKRHVMRCEGEKSAD